MPPVDPIVELGVLREDLAQVRDDCETDRKRFAAMLEDHRRRVLELEDTVLFLLFGGSP